MRNIEIRVRAKERGVFLWEIASAMGVSDMTITRKLRKELSTAEKEKLLEVIDYLAQAKREVE